MKEFKLGGGLQENLLKVVVNDDGDAIYINPADTTFQDRYADLLSYFQKKGDELQTQAAELSKKYEGRDLFGTDDDGEEVIDIEQLKDFTRIQVDAYRGAADRIDALFGQNTLRKFFKAFYEINPDFVPDDECIADFLTQITPAVNQAYNTRFEAISKKYNRGRKGKHTKTKTELIEEYRQK